MAPQPSPAFPVRQATSADAPTIAELAAELGYHVGVDDVRQRLAALPATHIVLVATDQQRVVGWLHAFHGHSVLHGDRVEIAGLAVAGNRQGQGVGTALITHLETVGKWIGASPPSACCQAANELRPIGSTAIAATGTSRPSRRLQVAPTRLRMAAATTPTHLPRWHDRGEAEADAVTVASRCAASRLSIPTGGDSSVRECPVTQGES
jgi:N-acetylglutamate synthase-like GNAT family acetyltransferase